jgi:N-acetylglucosaminyldiphosphoundecaprenol N-acetyl-beta-D-mannosaminyltransferase
MQELIELVENVMAGPGASVGEFSRQERPRANILGVGVDAVDMERALSVLLRHFRSDAKGYVCAVGVHGILEALRCPALAHAFEGSTINVPDGTPTVWLGRLQGFRWMNHVTGPALMREMFSRKDFAAYSHYFYGGKPGVAQELAAAMQRQFPWAQIAGFHTPPFRDLNAEEERVLIEDLNLRRPDIIWVGISTPRQELWMRRMLPRVRARMMFGVGAAFDFHTGRIRDCPLWVKRAGFHWLHRLLQDPRRLWRRNAHNAAFLWHIALQFSGIRQYPSAAGNETNKGSSAGDRMVPQIYSNADQADAARFGRQE